MTPEQRTRLEELLACWTPWSDSHDAIDAAIADADRLEKLEAAIVAVLPFHSGSCCRTDAAGITTVTPETCACPAEWKTVRALLGEKARTP